MWNYFGTILALCWLLIMKNIKVFSIAILLLFSGLFNKSVKAETTDDVLEAIAAAIRTGNAKDIAKYFGNTVDLTLPNSENEYGKLQAEILLKNFFQEYSATGFKTEHKGSSAEGARYMVGTYTSSKGNFKAYVLVKETPTGSSISEIKFEKM